MIKTVQDLINALDEIEDKNLPVTFDLDSKKAVSLVEGYIDDGKPYGVAIVEDCQVYEEDAAKKIFESTMKEIDKAESSLNRRCDIFLMMLEGSPLKLCADKYEISESRVAQLRFKQFRVFRYFIEQNGGEHPGKDSYSYNYKNYIEDKSFWFSAMDEYMSQELSKLEVRKSIAEENLSNVLCDK